jgi:hypothetical protein
MNLYDYSQRNNREMGILLRRTDEDSTGWNDRMFNKDDDGIFQDAIAEIKSIINGSEFEKDSRETRTIGFEMDIIKTNYDLTLERCHKYNQYSKNKKFIPFQSDEEWYCKCENFLDNVDLVFENGKAKINLNYEENRLQDIYQKLSTKSFDNDFRIVDCFRMFWTYHKSSISLYELKGNSVWEIKNSDEFHQKLFIGLNEVFKILKPVIQLTKK